MNEVTGRRLGIAAYGAGAMVGAALTVYVLSVVDVAPPMWLVALLFGGPALFLVALATLARRDVRLAEGSSAPRSRPSGIAGFLTPFVVLVPGLVALLASVRVQLSFHGYLHSAYVYEVLNGRLPPDNPLLAGEPANEYWLFHVFVAAVSFTARLAPPLAAALVNVAALAASIAAICWTLRLLDLWPKRPLSRGSTALVVLFGLNLLGAFHVVINRLVGSEQSSDVMDLDVMLVSGAPRSAGLFAKFLNFNGFPLGVAFFLLALACAVRLSKEVSRAASVGFVAATLATLVFHITTGVFAVIVLPISLGLAWLTSRPIRRLARAQAAVLCGGALVGLLVAGHYAMSVSSAVEEDVGLGGWDVNLVRFLAVAYPLIPLFVLGAAEAVRRRRADLLMLVSVGVSGAIFASSVVLPGGNQYKFDYLALFAFALVAVAGWRTLHERARAVAVGVAVVAVAGVASAQLYIGINYLDSEWMRDETIGYAGIDIVGRASARRSDAWDWIRRNTPPDSVVVVPLMNKDRARFLAISQRPAYVLQGGPFTAENPEFADRVEVVRTIYSPESSGEWVAAVDRLDEDAGGPKVILAAVTGRQVDAMQSLGMQPVFQGRTISLYDLIGG